MIRRAAAVVLGAAALVSLAGPVPNATAAATGYGLEAAHLVGETPAGFHVYVDPRARDHARLASLTRTIAHELHGRYGLPVIFAGYGRVAAAEGRIIVGETSTGCSTGSEGATYAVTIPYFASLAGADRYVSHSAIIVCPRWGRALPTSTLLTALRHEFGHAMGLSHTNYRYRGRYQVMYAGLHGGITDYQAGDIRGLRALAANASRVRAEMRPTGDAASEFVDGAIVVHGAALLKYLPSRSVTVTITDNGRPVYRAGARRADRSVSSRYHVAGNHGYRWSTPWAGGTHTFCAVARSDVDTRASATLGCITWRG